MHAQLIGDTPRNPRAPRRRSLEVATLEAALELHKKYPANKASLAGKRGPAPRFNVPEEYPSLRGKYKSTLDYEGQVVQSCIHCHQVRDAE